MTWSWTRLQTYVNNIPNTLAFKCSERSCTVRMKNIGWLKKRFKYLVGKNVWEACEMMISKRIFVTSRCHKISRIFSEQNQSWSRRNDTWPSRLHLVFRSPCFQWETRSDQRLGEFVRSGCFSSTNQGNFWPDLHRNCLRGDRWAIEKDISSEVMRTHENAWISW